MTCDTESVALVHTANTSEEIYLYAKGSNKETCQSDLLIFGQWLRYVRNKSKETYLYEKRPIKETYLYAKGSNNETCQRDVLIFGQWLRYVRHTCRKRSFYLKRDLQKRPAKETHSFLGE